MKKKFSVVVTPEAQAGIRESFLYIHERSPLNAERWLRQLSAQVATLEQSPERCARARECDYLEEDLRQFVFKSHRVVFQVDKASGAVYVLHVRHRSRRAVGEPEEETPESLLNPRSSSRQNEIPENPDTPPLPLNRRTESDDIRLAS